MINHLLSRSGLPRMLTHTVTFGCNARCIMCDSWKKDSTQDLTLAEIENIYKQLPNLDALRWTGGEPFVRPDFPDIVELGKTLLNPKVMHVTTNAFLTDTILKFCEQRDKKKKLDILISLDGPESLHIRVRGRDYAYRRALETIHRLKKDAKAFNVRLAVNQTLVDHEGIEAYRFLRGMLSPLGVQHNLVVAYEKSATYSVDSNTNLAPEKDGDYSMFGNIGASEFKNFLDEVDRDLDKSPWMFRYPKKYYLKGIRNRVLHQRGEPNPPCAALSMHLRLFPNGDVPTCQYNSRIIGNLRKDSFATIWKSEIARVQKQWVKKCPGCWAECEILPSAVYSGDLVIKSLLPSGSAST